MPIEPIFWNWLILAALFLLIEAFTPSFFFMLWAGSALVLALITGLLSPNLSLTWQLLLFTLFSLIDLILWWKITRHWQKNKTNDTAIQLNNRAANLIGRRLMLERPIQNGQARIQIDDSLWSIRGDDLPAGEWIEITAVDGLTLEVRPLNNKQTP